MAAILSSLLAHCETLNNEGRYINGKEFLLALALGVDIASFLGISAKGELKFFVLLLLAVLGQLQHYQKYRNFLEKRYIMPWVLCTHKHVEICNHM